MGSANRQVFPLDGFGEGEAGGAEDGDEDLRLTDLASSPVNDWDGLAGVIDEELFASAVRLAHHYVDLGGPKPVVLAEPAVLEALRLRESRILPVRCHGYAETAQLCTHPGPIWHRPLVAWHSWRWREQDSLQLGVRQ